MTTVSKPVDPTEIDHDQTQGGTSGNPHADSASDTDLSNHTGASNPHSGSASDNHDNSAHSETYLTSSDVSTGTVVASGSVDPSNAIPEFYDDGTDLGIRLWDRGGSNTNTIYTNSHQSDVYYNVRLSVDGPAKVTYYEVVQHG